MELCVLKYRLNSNFNGQVYKSDNGLKDLLEKNITGEILYPIVHLKGDDIELAMTHSNEHYSEEYYSYVNGQYTTQGGTHQAAFREAVVKTIREFYKKDFDPADVRKSIIAAISVRVQEPVFESQTKTKLGSQEVAPGGQTMRSFVGDFIKQQLDNYLHKNPETARAIEAKIVANERERKELSGIQKLATRAC
jgi:topoisomerase-4 subunit B